MARALKAPVAVLPSITELGRVLGDLVRREEAIDIVGLGKSEPANERERQARASQQIQKQISSRLLYGRLDALRSLVGTMPAASLSDCVVQLNIASHWIFILTGQEPEPSEVREICDNLERIMISVMPVLAATAGLDVAEYALGEVIELHESRFLEVVT